ncbi:MAG TPA: hypothetical protein VNO35_11415 [Steroidobacteraceae bacterium]|nr:hypothetical protein [Steroidobacteraceae bacterium]
MQQSGPLDALPLFGVYLIISLVALLAVELGFRLARNRLLRSLHEDQAPVGAIVGATLGLLAFLLAFTFGLAASRFDARKSFILDEANAIGTTYLRAALLPEPQCAQIRALLREYVDVRLQIVQPDKAQQALRRSIELQDELWSRAVAATDEVAAPTAALFITSVNELIDLHAKRVNLGIRNRVPISIWAALYFVSIVTMAAVGYHGGLTATRRSPAILALVLTFSAVILLIADLDRPYEGLLTVNQQAILDLRDSFRQSTSRPPSVPLMR